MSYISLEKLFKDKNNMSIFKLVLTAAGRANELAIKGSPLIETDSKKVSTIALLEIVAGKVGYEEKKGK